MYIGGISSNRTTTPILKPLTHDVRGERFSMFSFTITTSLKKWLVVRVPSGSVAIYESGDSRRRRVPVALSDMADAVDYLTDRLMECPDRELYIWRRQKCVAYISFDTVSCAVCSGRHLKPTGSLRGSLDYCIDYLEELHYAMD